MRLRWQLWVRIPLNPPLLVELGLEHYAAGCTLSALYLVDGGRIKIYDAVIHNLLLRKSPPYIQACTLHIVPGFQRFSHFAIGVVPLRRELPHPGNSITSALDPDQLRAGDLHAAHAVEAS